MPPRIGPMTAALLIIGVFIIVLLVWYTGPSSAPAISATPAARGPWCYLVLERKHVENAALTAADKDRLVQYHCP